MIILMLKEKHEHHTNAPDSQMYGNKHKRDTYLIEINTS